MKRTFSNSNVKVFLKFQIGSIIDAIEDGILLHDKTGWIHKIVGEIILTWRRNGQHYLSIGATLTRYECY
jgi:transposase